MINFKALAATLLLATTATLAVPAANAADYCRNIAGGRVCATTFTNYDVIEAYMPVLGGSETIQVTCDGGWAYQSKGDWSKSSVDEFAKAYCEGRGNYAHS